MSKTEKLLLSLSAEEKELFKINADAKFMTLSQYIRYCVHKVIKGN